LSTHELLDAKEDYVKLLIYWASKETLYKVYGLKEVDFIEHLTIKPFVKQESGTIIGDIKMPTFSASFQLNYQVMSEYVLVYILNKID